MQPADRLTIPTCIGCGAMSQDQTCPVACAERRLELVHAGDYDRLAASAAACRARVRGLRAVAAQLASAQPAEGEWQAAYQVVQESARSALRRFTPPGGSQADPLPAAQTVVVWRCRDCGGVDAPQPCIDVCIWRSAPWVDAATYEAKRSRALGDRRAERSLTGLHTCVHNPAFRAMGTKLARPSGPGAAGPDYRDLAACAAERYRRHCMRSPG